MKAMTELDKIAKVVDLACQLAEYTVMPYSKQAINWGDLGCADVGTMNDGYYVIIEEATPTSTDIIEYVEERLVEAGFSNVRVTTEW